jgi:hypothetical protein
LYSQAVTVSQANALDLIERDVVTGGIIKLGGAWTRMSRHPLRMLQCAAIFEVVSDAPDTRMPIIR